MSNFNWCHGPHCHTYTTQSRVRGSKGNKVLRTIKIKENQWNQDHAFKYFCNQNCLFGFINKHLERIVNLAPRREPLETPINDPVKETHSNEWHSWTNTKIEKKGVDNV
jgi:hypothetical protein